MVTTAKAQIDAIRMAVHRDSSATVGCDELRMLCPDYLSAPEQFFRIAEIARTEGWNFAFLPDGTVEFSSQAAGRFPVGAKGDAG